MAFRLRPDGDCLISVLDMVFDGTGRSDSLSSEVDA